MSLRATSPASVFNYRRDIDGLRAVSVLAVVGFHAWPTLLPGGFVGVDVFFVISGYLISGIIFQKLSSDTFSFIEFYQHRIRRIFPALLVVLIAAWAAGWFLMLPEEFRMLGRHVAASVVFAANIVFWEETGYFDKDAVFKPLLHLWSLGVEEQFYLLWPIILIILNKFRINISVSLIIMWISSLSFYLVDTSVRTASAFYLPFDRFWELLSGAILAHLCISGRWKFSVSSGLLNISSLLGAILLFGSFFFLGRDHAPPGGWALIPIFGSVLLIASGSRTVINKFLLGNWLSVFVGLISYPLYLWHWPLLSFARISAPDPIGNNYIMLLVVASFVLATVTYLFIEKPIRFGPFRQGNTTVQALVIPMFVLALVGVVTADSGFPDRFPAVLSMEGIISETLNAQRSNRCFVAGGPLSFPDDCIDNLPEGAPLIVLWGDSHAAHLFPGLRLLQRGWSFRIAQFNRSSCPPLLIEIENVPTCKAANLTTISRIQELKPYEVILSAQWETFGIQKIELSNIDDTIKQLKAIGVSRIVLLGPTPAYQYGLPRNVYERYKAEGKVPHTIHASIMKHLDSQLEEKAHENGAIYVSIYKILCGDGDNCTARLGDSAGDLMAWDASHLTIKGADYVIGQMTTDILAGIPISSKRQ